MDFLPHLWIEQICHKLSTCMPERLISSELDPMINMITRLYKQPSVDKGSTVK